MNNYLSKTPLVLAIIFPVGLLFHEAAFFLVPFLFPVITLALVLLTGLAATIAALIRARKNSHVPLLIVSVTWLIWLTAPMQEFSIWVRFMVEEPSYKAAVSKYMSGSKPECLSYEPYEACTIEGPYIVFAWPGFSTNWIGIVYRPMNAAAPSELNLKGMAENVECENQPIADNFYVCGFH